MGPQSSLERVIACVLFPAAAGVDFSVFAEACLRFTPTLAVREGEAVFLDITGCEKHYSKESLSARIQVLASRFSSAPLKVAFTSDAGSALAVARWCGGGAKADSVLQRLPLEALADYVSPFKSDFELNKKVCHLVDVLKELGLVTVEDFLEVPQRSLASRFGKEAVKLFQAVEGSALQAWPVFLPAAKIVEQLDFPEEIWGLESILFGLRTLLDRATARLRGLAQRISVLQLEFQLTSWSTVQKDSKRIWRFEFPLPQGSSVGIMPLVQDRLDFELQRTPLPSPVQAIRLEILEMVPGGGAQKDFFCAREEEAELWNAWVGRLAARLGKENVFMAAPVDRYLPEKSWVKTLEVVKERVSVSADVSSPSRPSRMLKEPEELQLRSRIFTHSSGKQWRVQEWEGPERLSGEWWLGPGFDRDYYRISSLGGEQLWVFVDRIDAGGVPRFFLHGYFD